MARYVIFPGTAGSYADTADTNLLDADSAHLQQSIGGWIGSAGGGALTLSSDVTPVFGDFTGRVTLNGSSINVVTTANDFVPVLANTEYTISLMMQPDTADRFGRLNVTQYTSGVVQTGPATLSVLTAMTVGQFTLVTVTLTTEADAAFLRVFVRVSTSVAATPGLNGELMYWDAAVVRAGTDSTFVPSLRIVGTLFEAFDSTPDDPPIVFAADGTPLTVGDGWAGNLFTYSRHDGADAAAPIVAIFDAEDIGL